MQKLLIVEDEKNSREGLAQCIDWADLDIMLIGAVSNGKEALEAVRDCFPDIVMTDVRMPKMDGIELARELREMSPELAIIFISGYSDKEYLKSAIGVGATEYLFKPVDLDELTELLKKTSLAIGNRKDEDRIRAGAELKLRRSMPLLRERFLRSLISGGTRDNEEVKKQSEFLELSIPEDSHYAVVLVRIDSFPETFDRKKQRDVELFEFSVQNVLQEIIDDGMGGYVLKYDRELYACLLLLPFGNTDSEAYITGISEDLHEKLGRFLSVQSTVGIGRWVDSISEIRHSFRFAQDALARSLVLGADRVIYVDSNAEETGDIFMIPQVYFDRLTSAILNGDAAGADRVLDDAFGFFRTETGRRGEFYRNGCLVLASCMISTSARVDFLEPETGELLNSLHEQVLHAGTMEEIRAVLGRAAEELSRSVLNSQVSRNSKLVQEICEIINQDFREDVSITKIAKQVYLSPTYICLLFKQETGKTINEYLTEVRIEEAKRMLQTGKHKIVDVAASVGYRDQKYFCRLFKAKVGMNPSEYR